MSDSTCTLDYLTVCVYLSGSYTPESKECALSFFSNVSVGRKVISASYSSAIFSTSLLSFF